MRPDTDELRGDAELGKAWRLAEAALPRNWDIELRRWGGDYSAWALGPNAIHRLNGYGDSPAAALDALRAALEARKAAAAGPPGPLGAGPNCSTRPPLEQTFLEPSRD